jgi:hypothetical protein
MRTFDFVPLMGLLLVKRTGISLPSLFPGNYRPLATLERHHMGTNPFKKAISTTLSRGDGRYDPFPLIRIGA